jgi:hypothetical protein
MSENTHNNTLTGSSVRGTWTDLPPQHMSQLLQTPGSISLSRLNASEMRGTRLGDLNEDEGMCVCVYVYV